MWTNGKPATKSVTVGEWKEIARTVSHDGKHRMIVMLTPNNLFRFFEDTLITESMPLGPPNLLESFTHVRTVCLG